MRSFTKRTSARSVADADEDLPRRRGVVGDAEARESGQALWLFGRTAAGDGRGGGEERQDGERAVQEVVGDVDRDQAEDVVAVDEAEHGDDRVRQAEDHADEAR